jgi:DNA-binding FadR family transcriptional regulator
VTPPHRIPIEPHVDTRAEKMAEVVARRTAADIIERGLAPGDALDSEQALLERFAVSRESLREGLRLLEVAGLVTIRRGPGGGTFVGSVDPTNLGRFASLYYHMSGASDGELFEAYALADSLLAELAARHPGRTERRAVMEPFLDDDHSEPDLEHYMVHHAGFHSAVARLAGNRVLQITLHSVGLLVARHYVALAERVSLTLASARQSRPFVEHDHVTIARAICAGSHRRARTLMEDHVRHIVAVLESDGLDPEAVIGWM